jgi:DNA-binding Xre family transcriptional regulator
MDQGEEDMKYLHIRLEELLAERGLSKKKVCSALDIERTNFNRYYRDEFQRIDANLIIKLCEYFDCEVGDLFEIRENTDDNK